METATKNTLWKAGKGMSFIGFFTLLMFMLDTSFEGLLNYNLSGTFLALAGVCIAIYETLAHHYNNSVFKGFNKQWWDASISWENKYKYKYNLFGVSIQCLPVVLTDAWHLFKGLSTILILLACINYTGEVNIKSLLTMYAYYKIPFTIFYSYYLIKK